MSSHRALSQRSPRPRGEIWGNVSWVAVAGVAAVVLGVLTEAMPLVPLGLAGIALAAGMYIAVPALALYAFIVLRPSLENVGSMIPLGGANILGAMGAATVVGGIAYLAVRRPAVPRAAAVTGGAFLMVALVSLAWALEPEEGVGHWVRFALYPIALGVAAGTVRDARGFHRLVAVILAAAVVPVLVGLVQLATGQRLVKEGYASIQGPMVHPNSFALLLLVALTLGLVAFMQSRDVRLRRVLAVGLMLAAVCFFFTYARAAWGAFLGIVAVLALLEYRRLIGFGLVGIVILAVAFPTMTEQLTGRFADLSPTSASYADNSLSWRQQLWERMSPYVEERPLLGHGIASFLPLSDREIGVYDYRFQTSEENAAYVRVYPHNDYLLIAVELGLVGLALWVAFLLTSAAAAWRARRVPALRPYAIAVTALIVGLLAVAATDNVKDNQSVMFMVSALAGGLYGASRGTAAGRPGAVSGSADRAAQPLLR